MIYGYEFEDTEFMTAGEKESVLRAWKRFIKDRFSVGTFSKALYNHLIQHCSFIAHYDRSGFWNMYFQDPNTTQRFLDQFDSEKGCYSIEYGMTYWIDDKKYADINRAMVEILKPILPTIREELKVCQISRAEFEVTAAKKRLASLTVNKEEIVHS